MANRQAMYTCVGNCSSVHSSNIIAMLTHKHAEATAHRLLAMCLLEVSAAACWVASQTSKPAVRSVDACTYSFGQEYASQVAPVTEHPDHDHP